MLFRYALAAVLGFASVSLAAPAPAPASYVDLRSLLQHPSRRWSPQTQIFYPSDPNYANETTQRWTIYSAPSYLASIKPGTEEDVQQVVELCTRHNVPFMATGGGHGYGTSFGKLQNGLELDLGHFKSIDIDAYRNTMTIGGAVIFEEIFPRLYAAGKEIQTGSCSCVGMVGATLGAGVGRYQGLHGLLIDALLSVRMVTARGRIITVSATENSDLFWGMRGAGFNFGVVVSATYKIFDLTNAGNVMSADLIFRASDNASYFNAMATFQDRLPAELSLFSVLSWNSTMNESVIILNAVYVGPRATGESLIAPFLALGPIVRDIKTVTWNHLVTTAGFGLNAFFCQKGNMRSMYSVGVKKLDAPTYVRTFTELTNFWRTVPAARASTVEFEFFATQAVLAVSNGETSYPYRDIQSQVMLSFTWTDPSAENAANAMARQLREEFTATSGYPGLNVYVSYAHGDESLEAIYGADKLPRLAQLKRQWDPQNVFAFNNALPTKYP
ncbi:MAG: hypothetical protein M1816_006025 [Peltula sp. TS41687]|nr:MAG: hypothetical protein M1816_006025 [Peltula sp. TS41687]